ncbi:MAG: putative replication initiation protein [Microviridae sp.]|nr:MAG: putative replication initiation protein [Microviridae sp.]
MPCTNPYDAWPAAPGARSRRPVASPGQSYPGAVAFQIGCGQCLGCRLDRAGDWALRCVHEAHSHDAVSFVTLTYSEEFLPRDGSISKRAHQLFMKRLRKLLGRKLRFLMCGEYGEQLGRPHYHYVIFGEAFRADRVPHSRSGSGELLYASEMLSKAWPYGLALLSDFTHATAGYVARYTTKKITGKAAADYYRRDLIDPETGELRTVDLLPPFLAASSKPGLGSDWFAEFKSDALPSDFLILDGHKRRVPPFYVKRLSEPEREALKRQRRERGREHADNNTPERLDVRHESQFLRAQRLSRDLA